MAYIISSTSTAPPEIFLADLGWRKNTPFSNIDLTLNYTDEELYNSKSLKDALIAGHITATNEYGQPITASSTTGTTASQVACQPYSPSTATNVQQWLENLQQNSGNVNVTEHTVTSNNTISILHNKGRRVGVFIVDATGEEVHNAQIIHLSVNQVQINFGINFTGKIYLY